MKLLIKNTLKKIKKSFGRFFSITLIIALGISVFIGLREATASMLYTADNYYDENNLMDFKISSTYGLNDDDVNSINKLKNVSLVVPTYSLDVLNNGMSIRIHAIEENINNVSLIEGHMPKNNNECVADYFEYKIGDTISFEVNDLNEFLLIDKCKVTGLIKSVLYVRNEKGISTVGNGKLSSFVFVKKEVFKLDYYTEIYIIAKNSKEEDSYYVEYNKQIESLKDELVTLKPIREKIRYEEILKEASEKIISIKTELNEKISSAKKELQDAKNKLDNASKELEKNKTSNIKKIVDGKNTLISSRKQIIDQLKESNIDENNLESILLELSSNINNLKAKIKDIDEDTPEYINLNEQINNLQTKYDSLNEAKNSLVKIDDNLLKLEKDYQLLMSNVEKSELEINNGYQKYNDGLKQIETEESNALKEIADAQAELEKIEKPIWYLLDRTDNSGYISYKEDVVKVDQIAQILPVFFILIVILMISNTLSRMIEEERNEMGILQSNGFSKSNIIINYLIYVWIAGLFGITLGLTIGYMLIPNIVVSSFLARYYIPKLITIVSPIPFSLVILVTTIVMSIVTIFACIKELRDVPAKLLRIKPPKSGRKIFIEKITFLWKRLGFMGKTTVRNLFRYKKRVIMTILGVTGCSALLVAGMGLRDSIASISKFQYEDIIKYDSMYILKDNVYEIPNKTDELFKEKLDNFLLINQITFTFSFENKTEDVYIIVPSRIDEFNSYINLTNKIGNRSTITDNGAVITKQMADHLNIKVGDNVSIRDSNNELFIVHITDIVENYVSHYIYMNKNYYEELFKTDIKYNSIIASGKISSDIKLTDYDILMATNTEDIIKSFDSFVNGLNKIIIMVIVFACFLAFIVLYNLTIINVSERKREIATFKVLGFYDKEISLYIYRETLILTIVGVALGLFLGVGLHDYIMKTAETDNIIFLRQINLTSFILSAFLTLLFSVIVQLIINHTLRKIDMIDSLKSIE